MNNSSAYIEGMIADCTDIIKAAETEDVQDRINDFMTELSGFKFPLMASGSSSIPSRRNRNGMLAARGWLISQMSNLTGGSGSSISVNNQNSAEATATATASVDRAVTEVQNSALSEEDKEKLELLLSGIERSAKAKNEPKTIERIKEALDIAGKVTGLAPTVMQAVGSLASLF